MATSPLLLPPPPRRSPMYDPKTGLVSPEWDKWFQQLWLRVGGSQSAPIANLNQIALIQLISQVAPTVAAAMYTSPVGLKTVINSFNVRNIDVIAHTISVWLVPQGGIPGAGNNAVPSLSIPPQSTITIASLQYQVINGGGSIQAQADTAGFLQIIADGRQSS